MSWVGFCRKINTGQIFTFPKIDICRPQILLRCQLPTYLRADSNVVVWKHLARAALTDTQDDSILSLLINH